MAKTTMKRQVPTSGNLPARERGKKITSISAGWSDDWDRFLFFLLGISLAMVPFLIRIKTGLFLAPRYTIGPLSSGPQGDAFSYYKFVFVGVLGVAAIGALVCKIVFSGYRLEKHGLHLPLLLLTALFLLSTLWADYKSISLYGLYNRREGTLTYIGFLLLMYALSHLPYREKIFGMVKACLSLMVIMNSLVCFSFYILHYDLGKVGWIQSLILPGHLPGRADISLPSLLENVNYSSGFNAAACAFFLTVSLLTVDTRRKIFPTVMASFSFFGILAAVSMSGILTISAMFFFLTLWAFFKLPKPQVWKGLCWNLSLFLLIFFASITWNANVYQEIDGFFKKFTAGMGSSATQSPSSLPATDPAYGPERFMPRKPSKAQSSSVLFAAGRDWPTGGDHGSLPARPPQPEPSVTVARQQAPPVLTPVTKLPAGNSAANGHAGKEAMDELYLPPKAEGLDPVRIYIWKHTLSLIAQKPVLGHGMDTLPYYIPQYTKERYAAFPHLQYPSKPHNFYLGIAFGAGIPALLCMLFLFGSHLWAVGKVLLHSAVLTPSIFQTALVSFFLSYMVQWLVNDSTVATSIYFWALLGVSISLHRESSWASV